ncbi:uncharacterized protein LOC116262654 isoform X2 [Nymphaea colorata]|uniref:uncharacterized protein LOC116262654 isoform X2 n=1 Tax=Nymphaea colorata TaxID=210225 RepID=UPI00129E265D|nr:uncharacterized protein LOC116262654 isoform X2 [Nymphaea colorata]
MAGNLQRWERDPLFSAAEIVQDSADRMESAFRTLLHEQSLLGDEPADQKLLNSIEFHRRDLLTALGTTKWQLEDFERAVGLSSVFHNVSLNTDSVSRHSQFIKAIREQITLMEQNLRQSSIQNGNGDNQWVNLNEQDRDQLALFLCGGDSSESVSYDTDRSNLRASPYEPTASGLDDGSDEIIELKVDETHNYEENICHDTKFLRHSDYGIQSKSAPHLNYLDQNQVAASQASSEMNCNGEQKSNEQVNGFFQGTNHGIYTDSRTWDMEGTGSTKNRLKSFRSRVDLRGLLSYLNPTNGAKMSRSFIKRRKDGETSHDYVLDVAQIPSSSATGIFNEQGLISVMLPRIWTGSLQRKFQRIHNFLRYKQFPVRVTPMVFITLGVIGLLAFRAI